MPYFYLPGKRSDKGKRKRRSTDYGHIQYVLDCIHDNTTEVRNIKAYMLTTLYNASMTIDHYYSIIPSKEIPGLIFRMDWLDLLAVFSNTTVQKHQFFTTQLSL